MTNCPHCNQPIAIPGLDAALCPHCGRIGTVIAHDGRLGFIFECSKCTVKTPEIRLLTWVFVNGGKTEVLKQCR